MTPTPFGESKGTVPAFPEARAEGAPKTDPMAIAAFVTSLLGAMCIPVLSSVVAIVLAVISLRNIQSSKGALGGRKLAIAGLVFGVLGILLFLAQMAMFFVLPLMDHGPYVAPPVATPVAAGPAAPTAAGPLPEGTDTSGLPTSPSWVELDYPEGSLTPDAAFAELARKAREQGRIPLVYVTAKGSAACDEVTRALASPEASHVSGKLALIRLDARDDAAKVTALGLRVRTVPAFVRLDGDGKRTRDVEASQWADNTPQNVVDALTPLVDP
jgi:hypothetical protein